jgi:phenylacetate-coenzyme A ligase PaaK-like adenylate-forming protein
LQAYEETIRDKIQKVMGGRVNIDFDYVDNIETEKSGKYKYVVSEVAGI